ncbi:SWF/SNF helicase family protein [Boseaceae bacterium BT-24-1]|nr:SWF/SNF helicase family protein [Boseaceae bacterium BT-24-1]
MIVSTESGSAGINLQFANVLVDCDLPWNPMIVEQRIGRAQRLGSISPVSIGSGWGRSGRPSTRRRPIRRHRRSCAH